MKNNNPPEAPNIEECVRQSLQAYLRDLGDSSPHGLYNSLLRLVERPLLQVVMEHTAGNQSRAAQWLGINRNTLRKKLGEYGMAADAPK